ncbi:MAG: type III polyketide synthase [Cytophagales bacterium]
MPFINNISTAVPQFKHSQQQILEFMLQNVDLDTLEKEKLKKLYKRTKINFRHSVLSDFSDPESKLFRESEPMVDQRMQLFHENASTLSFQVCNDVLDNSHLKPEEITHLISVSCTGISAPGIEQKMAKELKLKPNCELFAINFMGCYAGFHALKLANYIALSNSKAKILLFCVELCTIHFSKSKNPDNLLANSLFADGATAFIISNQENGLKLKESSSFLIGKGENDMAWEITPFNFSMKLTSHIPKLISEDLKTMKSNLLLQNIQIEQMDFFAVHPGGSKILDDFKEYFSLKDRQIEDSFNVLKEYGNMSSVTLFFILKQLMENATSKQQILSVGFGPGLTIESFWMEKV